MRGILTQIIFLKGLETLFLSAQIYLFGRTRLIAVPPYEKQKRI
jgi:hypothetical protein